MLDHLLSTVHTSKLLHGIQDARWPQSTTIDFAWTVEQDARWPSQQLCRFCMQ
jgi:hypothetical protein